MSVYTCSSSSGILTTEVDNSSDQGHDKWKTNGGNNTHDQIFLLSFKEANLYLGVAGAKTDNTSTRVAPTAYAIAQGAYINSDNLTEDGAPAGWWWLRSPGSNQQSAAGVQNTGSLSYENISTDSRTVRPAFWLNLVSDIF